MTAQMFCGELACRSLQIAVNSLSGSSRALSRSRISFSVRTRGVPAAAAGAALADSGVAGVYWAGWEVGEGVSMRSLRGTDDAGF